MEDYPTSPLSSPPYGNNINTGAFLQKVKAFGILCDFLDSLRACPDVSGGRRPICRLKQA